MSEASESLTLTHDRLRMLFMEAMIGNATVLGNTEDSVGCSWRVR
jgi:hypothetical protein